MIEIKSIKEKFNDKWWSLLGHHFDKPYMQQVYLKIMEDAHKGYKIFPKASVIYDRFKLINPDDVRVVFLTKEPIGSYKQSKIWQILNHQIELECYEGLHLNMEDNLDYQISNGIINLSPSLTVCNKSNHNQIGWELFTLNVMDILQNTDNKILFVASNDERLEIFKQRVSQKNILIDLEDGCFKIINTFLQQEYNLQIKW